MLSGHAPYLSSFFTRARPTGYGTPCVPLAERVNWDWPSLRFWPRSGCLPRPAEPDGWSGGGQAGRSAWSVGGQLTRARGAGVAPRGIRPGKSQRKLDQMGRIAPQIGASAPRSRGRRGSKPASVICDRLVRSPGSARVLVSGPLGWLIPLVTPMAPVALALASLRAYIPIEPRNILVWPAT